MHGLMHTGIYGYVKGGINSRIMKGNDRKNVNPINRISGFVCFFLGLCPLDPCPLTSQRDHCKGRCPLDPIRGVTPWTP